MKKQLIYTVEEHIPWEGFTILEIFSTKELAINYILMNHTEYRYIKEKDYWIDSETNYIFDWLQITEREVLTNEKTHI